MLKDYWPQRHHTRWPGWIVAAWFLTSAAIMIGLSILALRGLGLVP